MQAKISMFCYSFLPFHHFFSPCAAGTSRGKSMTVISSVNTGTESNLAIMALASTLQVVKL